MSKQIKIDTSIFNLDIVYDENMAKMVEYDIYDGK